MKRKTLKDIECMSGTGWIPDSDDVDLECPNCGEILDNSKRKKTMICYECGERLKLEYGQQFLVRVMFDDRKKLKENKL